MQQNLIQLIGYNLKSTFKLKSSVRPKKNTDIEVLSYVAKHSFDIYGILS